MKFSIEVQFRCFCFKICQDVAVVPSDPACPREGVPTRQGGSIGRKVESRLQPPPTIEESIISSQSSRLTLARPHPQDRNDEENSKICREVVVVPSDPACPREGVPTRQGGSIGRRVESRLQPPPTMEESDTSSQSSRFTLARRDPPGRNGEEVSKPDSHCAHQTDIPSANRVDKMTQKNHSVDDDDTESLGGEEFIEDQVGITTETSSTENLHRATSSGCHSGKNFRRKTSQLRLRRPAEESEQYGAEEKMAEGVDIQIEPNEERLRNLEEDQGQMNHNNEEERLSRERLQ